jgi:hypothetical protein
MTKAKWKSCDATCSCWRHDSAGAGNPNWTGDKATKHALHLRLKRLRGKAKEYGCVDCDGPALEWSQIHDTSGLDLWEHYEPRCRSCHINYDKRFRSGNPTVLSIMKEKSKITAANRSRDSLGRFV